MGFGVSGSGFGVQGLGLLIFGFRVQKARDFSRGLNGGFRAGFGAWGLGFRALNKMCPIPTEDPQSRPARRFVTEPPPLNGRIPL